MLLLPCASVCFRVCASKRTSGWCLNVSILSAFRILYCGLCVLGVLWALSDCDCDTASTAYITIYLTAPTDRRDTNRPSLQRGNCHCVHFIGPLCRLCQNSRMASKFIAQVIIQGTAIFSRAFVAAYQQALQSKSYEEAFYYNLRPLSIWPIALTFFHSSLEWKLP